jgi:hypothetical protein
MNARRYFFSALVLAAVPLVACEVSNTIPAPIGPAPAPTGPGEIPPSSCCGNVYIAVSTRCDCGDGEAYALCFEGIFSQCSCSVPPDYTPYSVIETCADAGTDAFVKAQHDAGHDAKSSADAHGGD